MTPVDLGPLVALFPVGGSVLSFSMRQRVLSFSGRRGALSLGQEAPSLFLAGRRALSLGGPAFGARLLG